MEGRRGDTLISSQPDARSLASGLPSRCVVEPLPRKLCKFRIQVHTPCLHAAAVDWHAVADGDRAQRLLRTDAY